jgi:FKBP-type peptidyl-prolyl cis-trans isomerase
MDIEGTMRKLLVFIGMVAFLFGYTSNVSLARQDFITMDNGLRYMDVETGSGAIAETGMIVVVHLIGWLDNNGAKGLKFISTYDRGKPVSFKLGTDRVMKAWSDGVRGMKTGGKRRLMVPSKLGYGEKGVGETVPPNANLVFDVELLEVR